MSFRLTCVVALVAATTILACSDSTTTQSRAAYSLQLHEDSAGVYGVMPECPPNGNLYCWAWRPSTAVAGVSLNGPALQVVQAGAAMDLDSTFNLDSLPFDATDHFHCPRLTMRITESPAGVVHGTWSEQLDCHGRTAMGTVTGTRD